MASYDVFEGLGCSKDELVGCYAEHIGFIVVEEAFAVLRKCTVVYPV